MNELPLIDGRGFTTTPETLAETIQHAATSYRNRTRQEPTHVALPSWADPAGLNLALSLARPTGEGGPVIVGRAQNGNGKRPEETSELVPEPVSYLRGGLCGRCEAEPIGPQAQMCWACGY